MLVLQVVTIKLDCWWVRSVGSFSSVTGLFRHKHSQSVEDGGSLTDETAIDSKQLRKYIILMVIAFGGG